MEGRSPRSSTYRKPLAELRQTVMDLVENQRWDAALERIKSSMLGVNIGRLDHDSFATPLHHAAEGKAPSEMVEQLIAQGAM